MLQKRFWFNRAAVGFEDLKLVLVKGELITVQPGDNGFYKMN